MLLCIDIGNTNIVLGLYRGEELAAHWRIATDHQRLADEYAILLIELFSHRGYGIGDVDGIALASVVPPLTGTFVSLSKDYFGCTPLVLDAGVRTGVRIRYDNPRDVGADRVANAVAAHRLYGGPVCVVDFGTACTAGRCAWWTSARPPSSMRSRQRGTTWVGPSRRASSSPWRPSSPAQPNCRALT